jgi:hypothetical protein
MTFPAGPVASPYRHHRDLAEMIPADRRWLQRTAIGAACFAAGLVALPIYGSVRDLVTDAMVERDYGDVVATDRAPALDPRLASIPSVDEAKPLARMPGPATTKEARQALSTDPGYTRQILLPIVLSGLGSEDDARILKQACIGLHDATCLGALESLLGT